MPSGTFQPVVGPALHRGELEGLQPLAHAVPQRGFRLVRLLELLIEVRDVGGDLLLDLRLGAAAEGFAFLFSRLYFLSLESGPRRSKVIFHKAANSGPNPGRTAGRGRDAAPPVIGLHSGSQGQTGRKAHWGLDLERKSLFFVLHSRI